jgi:hypothetical protein
VRNIAAVSATGASLLFSYPFWEPNTPSRGCSVTLDIDAWMAEAAEEAANPEKAAEGKEKRKASTAEGRPNKKSRLEHAVPAKKREMTSKPDFVCVLCPDLSNEMLLRVVDAASGDEPPTDNKRKPEMAHKICVSC